MERLLNQHMWPDLDLDSIFRQRLAGVASGWYDVLIENAKETGNKFADLIVEKVSYLFDVDLDQTIKLLQDSGFNSVSLNTLLVAELSPEKISRTP